MRTEALNWWKQAQRDLRAARNSLRSGDYEWASFQAHQASEKALKALFLQRKRTLPLTYDLVRIGKELGAGENLMRLLRRLNPDYVVARYPNAASGVPYELYDEAQARERIKLAGKVLEWTKKRLRL
jgi:HEPN domain-containing protein